MSKENVKLFYEALAKDKALQEKAIAIGKKYESQKLDDAKTNFIYQQELVPLAKDAGYDFTLAELQEYASEIKKPGMREVSEEELTAVAGGQACACAVPGFGGITDTDMACICAGIGSGNFDGGKVDCVCVIGGGGG